MSSALDDRIADLEQENRRVFAEAQREADAMFAQYQLSQLLASGGDLVGLATAVIGEVMRLCGASGAVLWLPDRAGTGLQRVCAVGADAGEAPDSFPDETAAHDWSNARSGWHALRLVDDRPAGLLALSPEAGELDPAGLRVLALCRHELAVAFRSAVLREALEQERRELTAMVEGATDAIIQVDSACRLVRVNAAADALIGGTAGGRGEIRDGRPDLLGRPCDEVLGCSAVAAHPDGGCPLAEVIASGRAIGYLETRVRAPDGSPIPVAGSYARTAGEQGEDVRATAILRDMRAVKALEQLREGFVATVSHELRTPLALIKGYADTLLHLPLEEGKRQAYVERIEQLTMRLTALVNDILDVTQLDAGRLVLERSPISLAALVARLRADLVVAGVGDRIHIDVPTDLAPVQADPSRIHQVLDNLVENAIKYAPPGTPVTISARVEEGWAVVRVEDEGMGIPADDAALVLEPFHRARNVRESTIPGTGLGLHIARRLVEAHGGQLELAARSGDGPGTRASFRLPLARSRRSPARGGERQHEPTRAAHG